MEYENERWLPVKDWNGKYWISDHGRFKSCGGKYSKMHPNGYISIGYIDTSKYRSVTLRRPGIIEWNRIHVFVATYFCDKPISTIKLFVNHKDGNKLNNHYYNLEWVTPAENVRHAVDTGLFNTKGERHKNSKLKESDVREMRRLNKMGTLTHTQIGLRFGVCRRQAGDVINGVNWGWLKTGYE